MYNDSFKSIAKGAYWVFIGIFLSKLLGYAYRLVVARIGVEDYGVVTLGITIFSILALVVPLGLPIGLTRYVPFFKSRGEEGKVKGAILSALYLVLFSSIVSAGLLYLFSDWISMNVFNEERLGLVLRIFAVALPFFCVGAVATYILRGFKKIKYEVFSINFLQNFVKVFLTGLLIFLGFNYVGAVWAFFIAVVGTSVLIFYFLNKKVFNIFSSKVKPSFMTKELVLFSFPLMFSGFFLYVVSWIDSFMIGMFRGVAEVGIYNAALPTAQLLNMFPMAMTVLFLPVISGLYAKQKFGDLDALYKIVTKWIFFINLAILGVFFIFSDKILSILFPDEYVVGAYAFVILSFAYFFGYLSLTSSNVLTVFKRTDILLWDSIVVFFVALLLNYLFIPRYGFEGAAVATMISFIVFFLLLFVQSWVVLKLNPFNLKYLRILFAWVLTVGLVWFLSGFGSGTIVCFCVLSVLFGVCYITLILLFRGFDKDDFVILKILEEKVGLRIRFLEKFVKRFL